MKKLLSMVVLTSLASLIVLGQAEKSRNTNASSEQEITKVRDEWYEAYFRGDTVTMDRLETEYSAAAPRYWKHSRPA